MHLCQTLLVEIIACVIEFIGGWTVDDGLFEMSFFKSEGGVLH